MGCGQSCLMYAHPKSGALEVWVKKPERETSPHHWVLEHLVQVEDIAMTIPYKFGSEIHDEKEFETYVIEQFKTNVTQQWSEWRDNKDVKEHLIDNEQVILSNVGYVEVKYEHPRSPIWKRIDNDREPPVKVFENATPWDFQGARIVINASWLVKEKDNL
eukprot:324753_1